MKAWSSSGEQQLTLRVGGGGGVITIHDANRRGPVEMHTVEMYLD